MAQDIEDEVDLVLIKPVRHHMLQNKAIELTRKLAEGICKQLSPWLKIG
jgi:hypothetical protein